MNWVSFIYVVILDALIRDCNFALTASLSNHDEAKIKVENDRIVNGTEAEKHAYPFVVRLVVWWDDVNGMCGGTLINSDYVMTAAHCVFHPSKESVITSATVYLGEHNRLTKEENRRVLSGVKVFVNKYSHRQHYNDIALIQLSESVNFTKNIQPACIVREHSEIEGQKATAIGWGALGSGKGISDVLRQVELPVLSDTVCEESYKTVFSPDVMLCAGFINGTKDTCQGDSGGPLFIRKEGNFTIIGMTSFGYGCASKGYPGVYTRISTFQEWIVKTATLGDKICIK